jgi:hypothetical protein
VEDGLDVEDRVVVSQGVVAVVVAEGAFGPALARRHLPDERELGLGDEPVRVARERRVRDAYLLARQHRGEDELGHVFGERRDGREDERGRAA